MTEYWSGAWGEPCPGRGAAFFTLLRRAGTVPSTGVRYDPGSAVHRFARGYALHCVRGTKTYFSDTFFGSLPLPATRT
jgi:hypothetical protein